MQFRIVPSPSDDVTLTPYQHHEFPILKTTFERIADDSVLRHVIPNPEEAAAVGVVLKNRSAKEITALVYRWVILDPTGKSRTRTVAHDSYLVDVYRPVAAPGARQLITLSGIVDEAFLHHALEGGGFVGSGSRTSFPSDAVEIQLKIDLIMFADGEIAGSDPDHFAAKLQWRKPAAEYVAKHIRSAIAEGRDAAPVLTALHHIPHFHIDHLARLVSEYAQMYLLQTAAGTYSVDRREAALRHLENRPTLPKLYRRDSADDRGIDAAQ